MMQTANGFPMLSPQVTLSGDEHDEPKNAERRSGVSENGIYHGYTMDIPCISPNAILIGKMMTQKPNGFQMVLGYPLFKTHPKNRRVGYASNFFPMVSLFQLGVPFWVWSEDNNWPIHTSAQSMREDVGCLDGGCGWRWAAAEFGYD
jgi:hypothetical protein